MKDQELNMDHILSGKMMYAYHYILRAPCRIYHTKGK